MVDVFIIVSGYIISYWLLVLTRNQDDHLLDALASSAFRRWFCLYGSTSAATFISTIIVRLAWTEGTDGIEIERRKETFLAPILGLMAGIGQPQ
jgi:hypothetical protein